MMEDWERYGVDGQYPGYSEYYFDELTPELLLDVQYPDSITFDVRSVPAYDPAVNQAVNIPTGALPLLAGLVRFLEWGALWNDPAAGYQLAALLQERLVASGGGGGSGNCWQDLTDQIATLTTCDQVNTFLANAIALRDDTAAAHYDSCIPASILSKTTAFWRLDTNKWIDSHNTNHLGGNASIVSDPLFGNVASFNGANQSLSIAGANVQTSGMMSVSCWTKPTLGGYNSIITKWVASPEVVFIIWWNSDEIQFYISSNGSGSNRLTTPSITPSGNNWYHIVATYDGEYQRVYVNGTVYMEYEIDGLHAGSSDIQIGTYASGSRWYAGEIADVLYCKDAVLTPAEVNFLYGNGTKPEYPFT